MYIILSLLYEVLCHLNKEIQLYVLNTVKYEIILPDYKEHEALIYNQRMLITVMLSFSRHASKNSFLLQNKRIANTAVGWLWGFFFGCV